MRIKSLLSLFLLLAVAACQPSTSEEEANVTKVEVNKEKQALFLSEQDIENIKLKGYEKSLSQYTNEINRNFLRGIDSVQAKFPDGGGYFIGITADPPESPIGYNVNLFGRKLLDAPRETSYCSGASYTAFIEGMNFMMEGDSISDAQVELLRMQEPDGGRREDGVKFWGNWNADGYGNYYALVSYSGLGEKIQIEEARPGDFMNISWKSGIGHSVVFLGWHKKDSADHVVYWSSQKRTNGLALDIVNMDRVKEMVVVRVTAPEKLKTFVPNDSIQTVKGSLPNLNVL